MENVELVTSVATFASLALALWNLHKTQRLKKENLKLKQRALLTLTGREILATVRELNSELNSTLTGPRSRNHDTFKVLKKIEAKIESLKPKLEGDSEERANKLLVKLKAIDEAERVNRKDSSTIQGLVAGLVVRVEGDISDQEERLI